MIRKYKGIMSILFLTLLLTGCWSYKDIDKKSIVLATGIDKVNGKIEFVSEIANLSSGNTTKGEKLQITGTYSNVGHGKNYEEARLSYNAKVPLETFLGAQRVLAFSRSYAEGGIKSYINRNYNTQEFRNTALTVVCKEPVKEFLSGKVENDISIGYAVEDTIRYLSKIGGALYKTVQDINSDIYFGDIGYLLPYVTKNSVIEYLGLAAMKESKLVGIVNLDDSGGFLFILAEKPVSTMPIPHPSNKQNLLSIKSTLKKRKIKTSYEDNVINIYIDLELDSQLSYPYKVEPISAGDIKKTEDIVCKKIKDEILSAVERSKNEFECDVFGFARYFKSQNIRIYRKINWKEEYLNTNFHVNVKTKITNTNLIDTNAKQQD
jgi:spore germination protein KC